jgi:hypothetical protein
MEASFFVNQEALAGIHQGMRFDEEGLLRAFDLHRDLIHATAAKAYRRGRKALYELTPDDFSACFISHWEGLTSVAG